MAATSGTTLPGSVDQLAAQTRPFQGAAWTTRFSVEFAGLVSQRKYPWAIRHKHSGCTEALGLAPAIRLIGLNALILLY